MPPARPPGPPPSTLLNQMANIPPPIQIESAETIALPPPIALEDIPPIVDLPLPPPAIPIIESSLSAEDKQLAESTYQQMMDVHNKLIHLQQEREKLAKEIDQLLVSFAQNEDKEAARAELKSRHEKELTVIQEIKETFHLFTDCRQRLRTLALDGNTHALSLVTNSSI